MGEPNPVFEKNYMAHSINPISYKDGEAILAIFNHYVENTFAVYRDLMPFPRSSEK